MAIQIIPILKALAPLVANASGIVANLKSTKTTVDTDEKIRRLEEEAIEAGELLSAIAKQVEPTQHLELDHTVDPGRLVRSSGHGTDRHALVGQQLDEVGSDRAGRSCDEDHAVAPSGA